MAQSKPQRRSVSRPSTPRSPATDPDETPASSGTLCRRCALRAGTKLRDWDDVRDAEAVLMRTLWRYGMSYQELAEHFDLIGPDIAAQVIHRLPLTEAGVYRRVYLWSALPPDISLEAREQILRASRAPGARELLPPPSEEELAHIIARGEVLRELQDFPLAVRVAVWGAL